MKNIHFIKRSLRFTPIIGLALFLQACPEKEGPMERAGEAVDEAAQDAERNVEDATD